MSSCLFKMIPADALDKIDKALEDMDSDILLDDGIPADEALQRVQDAANSRIGKDDES